VKTPSGDKIHHPSSGHDDLANALCLAIAMIGRGVTKPIAMHVRGSSAIERLGYPNQHPGAVPCAGMPGRVRAYGAMSSAGISRTLFHPR